MPTASTTTSLPTTTATTKNEADTNINTDGDGQTNKGLEELDSLAQNLSKEETSEP